MASSKSIVVLQWLCFICSVTELRAVLILTANVTSVQLFDSGTPYDVTFVTSGREEIKAIDYHLTRGEIYFSDRISGQTCIIGMSLVNGGPKTPTTILYNTYADSIAVDWVHDKLYWTNEYEETIETATSQGSNRKVIISRHGGGSFATSLVLDPYEGLLFWRTGAEKHVLSAKTDGSSTKSIHSRLRNCFGLALDINKKELYIRTATGLYSSSYDGSHLKTSKQLIDLMMSYSGLTHFSNKLYYPDIDEKSVMSYNLETNQTESVFEVKKVTNGGWLMGIKVLHASLQPHLQGVSRCEKQCSQFCTRDENDTYSCKCPHGYTLDQDGISCIKEGAGSVK